MGPLGKKIKDMDEFDLRIYTYQKEILANLNANKGWIRRLYSRLIKVFSKGPRSEVAHNWLVTCEFVHRAEKYIKTSYPNDEIKIITLATIRAYLDIVVYERDFAQAWSYVNLACCLLPLVVDENELEACVFHTTRRWKQNKNILSDIKEKLTNAESNNNLESVKQILSSMLPEIEKVDSTLDISCSEAPVVTSPPQEGYTDAVSFREDNRTRIFRLQMMEANKWNIANRQISLKLSLWRSLGYWILVSLLIAIIVAEILFDESHPTGKLITIPYVFAAFLGFFGGGLSAFLTTRDSVISITNYELIRTHTILRMILGAAGSFVVLVATQALNLNSTMGSVNDNYAVFIAVCIAAGFSERLFISALEKISDNLKISSDDSMEKASSAPQPGNKPN